MLQNHISQEIHYFLKRYTIEYILCLIMKYIQNESNNVLFEQNSWNTAVFFSQEAL